MTGTTEYEQDYTAEQKEIAEHLITLEKAALDKWFDGDGAGYRELWSRRSFSYFDARTIERVDNHQTIDEFLTGVDGKLHADTYDFRHPRVQFGTDMALLTFQLYAKTNLNDMQYNCIELYQKEDAAQWRVVHSTWSIIRPMDVDFTPASDIVLRQSPATAPPPTASGRIASESPGRDALPLAPRPVRECVRLFICIMERRVLQRLPMAGNLARVYVSVERLELRLQGALLWHASVFSIRSARTATTS